MEEKRKKLANDKYFCWLYEELYRAYLDARKGKRRSVDENLFEMNLFENLYLLAEEIYERRYKPSRGIAFIIREPVIREVFAAPFRDRVVHHFLYNMNAGWWERRLIYDSYSCRVGKGTLFGVKRMQHFMRSVSRSGKEEAFVIKMDIKGYFMSLPRKGLYERILWGLERQYPDGGRLYDLCKFLWREIIFDDPTKGVHRRGKKSDWDDLPKSKSLFNQPEGQGIVIGNLTSQLLSNIYLDQLDRFVTMVLGYRAYGRYVDDFYIIVDKEHYPQALRDIKAIEQFLEGINLTLHPQKRYIQPVRHGAQFIGARVYPTHILPGRRLERNFRRAMKEVAAGERAPESVASYLGLMKHFKHRKLESEVFEELGWEYRF